MIGFSTIKSLLNIPSQFRRVYIIKNIKGFDNLNTYPKFPFSLRILYISSICYTIAIALYQYFCPRIIKLFETELDYINSAYPVYLRAHPDRKYEIVLANLIESQSDLRRKLLDLKRDLDNPLNKHADVRQRELDSILDTVYPSCVQRYLTREYNRALQKHPIVMWLSGLLYFFGTLLLLYLLVDKSVNVFKI